MGETDTSDIRALILRHDNACKLCAAGGLRPCHARMTLAAALDRATAEARLRQGPR